MQISAVGKVTTFQTHNLPHKLRYYGIRGKALDWFRDYLSNKKQFVRINGLDSQLKQFIVASHMVHSCFADDSNLFITHRDSRALIDIINRELKSPLSYKYIMTSVDVYESIHHKIITC